MPIAKLNDVDLYYEIEGEQGPWLVFAHGGGDNHLHWWRQVGELRDRYRCVTYDARWHGRSSQGSLPTPPDAQWKDLLGLLDFLKIDRAFLNGHSMGGAAVSGVAINRPERVRGIIMTCTALGFRTETQKRWAAKMVEEVPKGLNIEKLLFAPDFATREPALFYLCAALRRLNPVRPVPRESKSYVSVYEAMRDLPVDDYSRFAVPSLFVLANQDDLQWPWVVEGTAKAVAGSQLVRIEGSGHNAHVERTPEYNAALLAFLKAHA